MCVYTYICSEVLLLIVLEVLIIVYLPLSRVALYVGLALSAIVSLVAMINLVNKDANPEYKISWMVVIILIMPLGAALYFMFYTRRMSKREARLLRGAISELRGYNVSYNAMESLEQESSLAAGKARALTVEDGLAEVYRGTESVVFSRGENFLDAMISDLELAEEYIFMEFFQILTQMRSVIKVKETL